MPDHLWAGWIDGVRANKLRARDERELGAGGAGGAVRALPHRPLLPAGTAGSGNEQRGNATCGTVLTKPIDLARLTSAAHPFSCTAATLACCFIAVTITSTPPCLAIVTWFSAFAARL